MLQTKTEEWEMDCEGEKQEMFQIGGGARRKQTKEDQT